MKKDIEGMYTIDVSAYQRTRVLEAIRGLVGHSMDQRVLINSAISLLVVVAIVAATGITA